MNTVSLDNRPHATTRAADPDTSHEAAATVDVTISQSCGYVLQLLRSIGPADDETLQAYYDVRVTTRDWPAQRCVRKRRHDLLRAGLVKWTGRKVKNSVGLSVREWEAV